VRLISSALTLFNPKKMKKRQDLKKTHATLLILLAISAIGIFTIITSTTITGMTPMSIEVPYYPQKNNGYYPQETIRQIPTYPEKGPAQAHKIEAMDHIHDFFGKSIFFFPQDPCARMIHEQIDQASLLETARIETFSGGTGWTDKYQTILFEGDKTIGKITLVHGFGNPHQAKMNYEIAKTIVSINAWQETMTLRIELEGINEAEAIFFTKGSLQVFDFECKFGY